MRHRKQYPEDLGKQLCEQTHEVPSAISFAFLSVKLPEAKGTNILARLATAAWSLYEQHDLWKRTELFFQRHMGCLGRVIKVHGDLQPPASYLIMAPGVQLFPDVLEAAREFVTACTSFKSLEVQLQIGRSAVVNNTGKKLHKLLLSCSCDIVLNSTGSILGNEVSSGLLS